MFRSIGKISEINSFRQLSSYDWGFCSLRILPLHDLDLQTGAVLSGNWFVPLQSGAVSLTYSKVFLAQGLGMGIAIGIMYIPALGIVSHYFQKRRALAIGLATSVGALPLMCLIQNSRDNLGFCIRRGDPPYHAKRMVPRPSRISLRRQS
jgi:hypothetical protein